MAAQGYTFTGERQVRAFECDCCGAVADRTWAYLDRDGEACAVFFASCYHHQGSPEIYFDVILGTWGTDDHSNHVTFGARYGAVDRQREAACSLVTGAAAAPDSAIYGTKLDQAAALAHPRLAEFWKIVDFLIAHDPVVSRFIATHCSAFARCWAVWFADRNLLTRCPSAQLAAVFYAFSSSCISRALRLATQRQVRLTGISTGAGKSPAYRPTRPLFTSLACAFSARTRRPSPALLGAPDRVWT